MLRYVNSTAGIRGGRLALLGPHGALYAFDPDLGIWIRGVADGVLPLLGSASSMVLYGTTLYALAAPTPGATTSEVVAIDVFGGSIRRSPGTFPLRVGARLSVSTDGLGLVLAGGIDPQQRAHDDVWSAPFAVDASLGVATRSRADTTGVSFDADGAMAFADLAGVEVASVGVSTSRSSSTILRVRDDLGWDDADEIVARRARGGELCAAADLHGGERCTFGGPPAAWWGGVGLTSCAAPDGTAGQRCEGTVGSLVATGVVPELAADFSLDGASVWIVGPGELSRHTLGTVVNGKLTTREALSIHAPDAFAVSAHGGLALVLTHRGVSLASSVGAKATLTPPQPLCGSPVAVAQYGDGWVVATTRGVALVSSGSDGHRPQVTALGLLDEDRGTLIPVPMDSNGRFVCPHEGEREGEHEGDAQLVVTLRDGRVLLSREDDLFELDLGVPSSPRVTRVLRDAGDLAALRYDALGGRVYALAKPWSAGGPIFDLRGSTLTRSGKYALGAWVTRQDGLGVSARRIGPRVELAEVVR